MTIETLAKQVSKTAARRVGKGPVAFRPGFIVAVEFSALGGVTYDREDIREDVVGEGLEAEFKTVKRVDHVQLNRESRSIINAAYHVLEKHCAQTPIGYYADEAMLAKVEEEIDQVKAAAKIFNEVAQKLGSQRRVVVEIYPLELRLDCEAAARRLVKVVREKLLAIRDALAEGSRRGFELALDKAHNLDRLATGIQSDSIRIAIEHAKEQKALLLEALREGATPEVAAKSLNLEPIEAAVSLFTTNEA